MTKMSSISVTFICIYNDFIVTGRVLYDNYFFVLFFLAIILYYFVKSVCVISNLIAKNFLRKLFSEKVKLIKTGRPCPVISYLTSVFKNIKKRIYSTF